MPPMIDTLPSPEELRAMMAGMNYAAMERLSQLSGVPFHTIRKIKAGESADPKLSNARALWPHLKLIAETKAAA